MLNPESGPTFVRGPALAPADQLLTWLARQQRDGRPQLVRVPVVLAAPGDGEPGVDLERARLGSAPDALVIRANDALLGVGLAWHAMRAARGQPRCAFWVHGYLRGAIDGALQLDVVKVEADIAPDDAGAADFVEVERA